jgi:hypothetical protein
VGKVTKEQVREIAQIKLKDLNAVNLEERSERLKARLEVWDWMLSERGKWHIKGKIR